MFAQFYHIPTGDQISSVVFLVIAIVIRMSRQWCSLFRDSRFPLPPADLDPCPSSHHTSSLAEVTARNRHTLPSSWAVLSSHSQKAQRSDHHSDHPGTPEHPGSPLFGPWLTPPEAEGANKPPADLCKPQIDFVWPVWYFFKKQTWLLSFRNWDVSHRHLVFSFPWRTGSTKTTFPHT